MSSKEKSSGGDSGGNFLVSNRETPEETEYQLPMATEVPGAPVFILLQARR